MGSDAPGEREAQWVREMYRRIGLGDELLWRHYLGRWRGEPVATTSLFMGAGVAGLYFVSTAPQMRRQGFGGAISLAALRETRALGHRIGVLGSSPLGLLLYRQLGFKEYCTTGLYEWLPPTA